MHGRAFNIVAPEMTSIKELAELVVHRHPTELTFGEARPGDVPPAEIDAKLAEQVLGWKAETLFEEGLGHLLDDDTG